MSEKFIPTPVPALCTILLSLERQKGAALTEEEVLEARDNAVCIALPESAWKAMQESRGYRDLDLENVWEDWCSFRVEYGATQAEG